jgi:hypothetical protein
MPRYGSASVCPAIEMWLAVELRRTEDAREFERLKECEHVPAAQDEAPEDGDGHCRPAADHEQRRVSRSF